MLHTECLGWAEDGKEARGFFFLIEDFSVACKAFLKKKNIYFSCTGSLLLQGLCSSCSKQELLSRCGAPASH